MAWPVNVDEENVSSSSSTDNFNSQQNGSQNIYAEGAAGFTPSNGRGHFSVLPYSQNLNDIRDLRVSNPYINRIRNIRRYSTGDVSLSNDQRASGSNEINIDQRHSVPCCHMNPSVLHSCCLHLNRRMSLENSNLRRRNSFPQNCIHESYNLNTATGNMTTHTLSPHGQFSAYENQTESLWRANAEYERQRSFSISHSFLFGNENFQSDWFRQEAVSAVGSEFFMRFLANEMDRRGLQLPGDICRDMGQSAELPQSFIYLMEKFSASLEREMIFFVALRVQLPVSYNSFVAIIDGMNNGTDSPERIVTLFFFCADLAIRAIHDGNDTLFGEIVSWTMCYLRRSNSLVVVPSKIPSYKVAVTACLFGIIAVLVLMKRN